MAAYFRLRLESIEIVGNGIDPERYLGLRGVSAAEDARRTLGIPPESFVVGYVGRLADVKRVDRLLRAAAVAAQETDIIVLIVGDGPERSRLASCCAHLGIQDRVRFVGFQLDLGPFYSAMDAFCLPSRGEAFGLVVLEAMSAGLPVLGFRDAGGGREVIEASSCGRLVSDVHELAHVLAIQDTERRSHSGREDCLPEACRLDRMASEYRRLYAKVAGCSV